MASEPWSFNQPVLLNKTRHNSSVLVWTLVGATVFATGWAFLAPLPETVAVQGKLQPDSPFRTSTPRCRGLWDVLVSEERVNKGQPLVRFDPREVKATLEAATINRNGLRNQIVINRVLLGERPDRDLTPNQQALLNSTRLKNSANQTSDAERLARAQVRLRGTRKALQTATTVRERYERLLRDGAASELQVLSALQDEDQLRSDAETVEREVAQLQAAATSNSSARDAVLRKEIEDNLRKIADLDQQITQSRLDLTRIMMTAPIDGVCLIYALAAAALWNATNNGHCFS